MPCFHSGRTNRFNNQRIVSCRFKQLKRLLCGVYLTHPYLYGHTSCILRKTQTAATLSIQIMYNVPRSYPRVSIETLTETAHTQLPPNVNNRNTNAVKNECKTGHIYIHRCIQLNAWQMNSNPHTLMGTWHTNLGSPAVLNVAS